MSKTDRAEGKLINYNLPPDMPDVPIGLAKSDGLEPEVRRQAQTHLSRAQQLDGDARSMDNALWGTGINLALQCAWLSFASFIGYRGYKYIDHTLSFARSYTQNEYINRMANPYTMLGILMGGITCYQLPTDISFVYQAYTSGIDARTRRDAELAHVKAIYDKYPMTEIPQKKE